MLEWNDRQRGVLIDKLSDAANVAAGGLVFGQVLTERPFSIVVAACGFGLWIALLGSSLFFARNRRS